MRIAIYGAAGTGRELADIIVESSNEFVGFIDDYKSGPCILGNFLQIPILASQGVMFASAIGGYKSMRQRAIALRRVPAEYRWGVISRYSHISRTAQIGGHTHIFPFSVIAADSCIETDCLIYHHSVVAHDSRISKNCIISNSVTISGNCLIGENTYLGAGVVVKEDIRIGENCIIAAGAVVFRDVPDNTIYISQSDKRENPYFTMES